MNDLQEILANRIRTARENLSLTQKQLADAVGFSSSQIIHQIESRQREVKAWELCKIAQALRVDVTQLLALEPLEITPFVLWRKAPENDKAILEADFLQRCNEYAFLEKLSGEIAENDLPSKQVNLHTITYEDAGKLGETIWKELKLGSRPASCIDRLLEDKYGVKIWYQDLGVDGSAASAKGTFGLAVLINSREPPWRRNYSFAHELFHLITWDSTSPESLNDSNYDLFDHVEKIADSFASSLLLPLDDLINTVDAHIKKGEINYVSLIDIAREFDVSTSALLWRLHNIDALDKGTIASLLNDRAFKELDKAYRAGHWWQPPDIPSRFVRLAFTAYQKGQLSRTKLAEYLKIGLADLSGVLLEYGFDDHADYQATVPASGHHGST